MAWSCRMAPKIFAFPEQSSGRRALLGLLRKNRVPPPDMECEETSGPKTGTLAGHLLGFEFDGSPRSPLRRRCCSFGRCCPASAGPQNGNSSACCRAFPAGRGLQAPAHESIAHCSRSHLRGIPSSRGSVRRSNRCGRSSTHSIRCPEAPLAARSRQDTGDGTWSGARPPGQSGPDWV